MLVQPPRAERARRRGARPLRKVMWLHRAFAIATNLVPLAGVFWFGWSASTLLLVFWGETLLVGTANVIRIGVHRRLTRLSGHWRPQLEGPPKREPRQDTTFLAEYAAVLYVFTPAHGFFLLIFLIILDRNWGSGPSPWEIDAATFWKGILALAGITLLELLYDLVSLGQQPFSWLKSRVQATLGRVLILHLAVLFGAFLMMRFETPMTFLGILVGLKALMDLATAGGPVETPTKAPRWFAAVAKKQGLDGAREWANILAEQKRLALEDEKPLPPG